MLLHSLLKHVGAFLQFLKFRISACYPLCCPHIVFLKAFCYAPNVRSTTDRIDLHYGPLQSHLVLLICPIDFYLWHFLITYVFSQWSSSYQIFYLFLEIRAVISVCPNSLWKWKNLFMSHRTASFLMRCGRHNRTIISGVKNTYVFYWAWISGWSGLWIASDASSYQLKMPFVQ